MPKNSIATLPQPVFDESSATPDPTRFKTDHPSDSAMYKQLGNLLKKQVVSVPASRAKPDDVYKLEDALGPHGDEVVRAIQKSGQITFHTTGDSGASNVRKYRNEIRVSDQMTLDIHNSHPRRRPAFLYHLGDVVYNFGESKYYYDQFYEPYRNYAAPIFAIPGNHDCFVLPHTPKGQTPLEIFTRNFCAPRPEITLEAASLHRTAMTQPGVYFTLDAPFVRIIGLFSNALEDPGVISSEEGKWPGIADTQLKYLSAQLKRIQAEQYKGAVLLAVHHPPFSYAPPPKQGSGGNHSSSTKMLAEIDKVCDDVGVYPHAFLSAHAHNYQRYTRFVKFGGKEFDVPFIVCGDGGHNVNPIVQSRHGEPAHEPLNGSKVDYLDTKPKIKTGGLLLEKYDDHNYGYLRIAVDKEQLRVGFHQVGAGSLAQSRFDMVTVDLESHTMVSN